MIPEIDIWRAATLMLKRFGDKALEQSATRADELASDGDHAGADTWRRIHGRRRAARQHRRRGRCTDRTGAETVDLAPAGLLLKTNLIENRAARQPPPQQIR